MNFKENSYNLFTELASNLAKQVQIVMEKKLSAFSRTYQQPLHDSPQLDLKELAAVLKEAKYEQLETTFTETTELFRSLASERLETYCKSTLKKLKYTFEGLDLLMTHFIQLAELLLLKKTVSK